MNHLTTRGFKRLLVILLLMSMLILQPASVVAQSDVSLTHEDITAIIEATARRKNIPPDILKAIAWKESRKSQFTQSGTPLVSRGNRGIMQINQIHTDFDANRLLNDVTYNIEAGADILLSKWLDPRTPTVGNRDPNKIEHWYFALWAYNGWLSRNNPNQYGSRTYQDSVFNLITTRYGQETSTVDWHYLPANGIPGSGLNIPEPAVTHDGGILFFQPEDRAVADVRNELHVLDGPNGDVRFSVHKNTELVIASPSHLHDGLYWYEVLHPSTARRGWAAGIYLKPVFVQNEASEDAFWSMLMEPALSDFADTPDEESIESEDAESLTGTVPQEPPDEGENALEQEPEADDPGAEAEPKMQTVSTVQPFTDMADHPAGEAVETLASLGVFSGNHRNEFRPHQPVTRQEMALILHKFFDLEPSVNLESMRQQTDFRDWNQTDEWARASLMLAASRRIITGYPDGTIRPLEAATREQGMVMIVKALEDRQRQYSGSCISYFDDGESINQWAHSAMDALLGMGIFEDVGDTSLNPQQELTRVELAVVLYRIHQQSSADVVLPGE
jgi:hypothetical protein